MTHYQGRVPGVGSDMEASVAEAGRVKVEGVGETRIKK